MTADGTAPSQAEAIRLLEEGRARIEDLLGRLPSGELLRAGVGGGAWSPKDLIGHLASWEEYALDAMAAWERGERAPIDDVLFTVGVSRLNEQAVGRRAGWSLARVRRDADRTHEELIAAIRGTSAARWHAPATARGRRPMGARLGAILAGSRGELFTHADAHVRSLASFVQERRPEA